jgi:hypothetical protein
MRDLESRLRSLRYFGMAGPPNLGADFAVFDLSKEREARAVSERYGIAINSYNPGNLLFVHREARRLRFPTPFNFYGDYNTVILDHDCSFHGALNFLAHDNLVVLMGGQSELALDATLYGGDTLVWGRGSSAWGVRVWVQGGTVCTISDGCLLSENISIRTTDHHSIIDLTTWEQINRPADITIGRHVWVGPNVRINKGVEIGDGAILAADSLVATSIPRTEIWGGAPAKMLRKNVSWVLSHPVADHREIAALRDLLRP